MTDIKTIEKIVAVLDVLSNTVGNLVNSVDVLKEQVVELQEENRRLCQRSYVDRFDIG